MPIRSGCGLRKRIRKRAGEKRREKRKQFMSIYVQVMESIHQDKKNNMAGQITLFDLADEKEKENYDIRLPEVGEYSKEMLLAFEKEVLGIYISGHPLEEYESIWRKHITTMISSFLLDEETGTVSLQEGSSVTVGGMIADRKIKYTKNDKVMAFLQLEDLTGSMEVVVFPKVYEKNAAKLAVDNKVFIRGRVAVEDEKDAKLICEQITSFEEITKTVWIKFRTMEEYEKEEKRLYTILRDSDGKDRVTIYIENPKSMKKLPPNMGVRADTVLLQELGTVFGEDNVKVV